MLTDIQVPYPIPPRFPDALPEERPDDPWISVLIPVYNRERTIAACLGSVLASRYRRLRIVVSDNASTDRTRDIVRGFMGSDGRITLLEHGQNRGPLPNWRSCLEAATGGLIHWLWSDDWIEPAFYRRLVDKMRQHRASMAVCAARVWHQDEGWQCIIGSLPDRPHRGREFVRLALTTGRTLVSPAAALLPADAVRRHFSDRIPRLPGIDCNRTAIGCDARMVLGSAWESETVAVDHEPLVIFRAHGDSITISTHGVTLMRHYAWAHLHWARQQRVPLRWCWRQALKLCAGYVLAIRG